MLLNITSECVSHTQSLYLSHSHMHTLAQNGKHTNKIEQEALKLLSVPVNCITQEVAGPLLL